MAVVDLKGSGKTLGETFYGLRAYLQGLNVYSNYPLAFPHVLLNSLEDIQQARDGLLILDDLESWLSSRNWKSKESQQVMQIILQGGKRRLTCLYSCKRPENVDVLLRDTTDFWCRCQLIAKPSIEYDSDFEEKIRYLDNLLLKIEVFDDNVDLVNTTYIDDLALYAQLYGSKDEVKKLVVPIEKVV